MALKESITAADVVDLLNELIMLDHQAINRLITHRVKCNQQLAEHPTVQVGRVDEAGKPFFFVGMLGILNGLFGTYDQKNSPLFGFGPIAAEIDEMGNVLYFKLIEFDGGE